MDCLFCKIAGKEINSEMIYEDADTVAVLDVHPLSLAHTMVLPKFHAADILSLPGEKIGPVFEAVKKVTGILGETFKPDGFTIGINHGRASGQTVEHLHIHIIPRWSADGGGSIHSVVNNPPQQSLDEVKNRILHKS